MPVKADPSIYPVIGWEVEPLPDLNAIFIRFEFLPNDAPERVDPGRKYVFLPSEARRVLDAIREALAKLESGSGTTTPRDLH